MKVSRWLPLLAATPLVLAGCGKFGEAMTAHTDIVARAAGKELKVQEAAEMLGSNPQIPPQPQVVQALADVWVDYTLLATAVAEDSTLGSLDVDAFIEPAREQALMVKLREQVIRADTNFTEAQIQQRWATDGPGVEMRARHILLRIPTEATQQQRDSVRALAESLRQRATGGEDFAGLARQFSSDPGSAVQGGDLGFFGRGRMVAPFEEAAFALQPGQVSQVVESPFGYHVIKAEERRQPELGAEREQFRQFMVQRVQQEAETAYLDSIAKLANVQVRPGGLAVVREIAARPENQLSGRAAEREIATFARGELTTGEFLEFIRTQPANVQGAFSTATDEQLEGAVQQLVRRELLLSQAEARRIALSKEEEDRIRLEARQAIHGIIQQTGLSQLAGRKPSPAQIDTFVKQLIGQAVNGQAQLVPLGRLGLMLREMYPNEINEGAFAQVVSSLEATRATQPGAPQPGMQGMPPMPGTPPVTPPDTGAR